MPLYRLEKGFQYDGVIISRQNMANWVIKSVELYLILIYTLFITFFNKETVAHSDGTHTQVLREPGRDAQTKSCVRVYRTSGCSERKIVIYEYTETKEKEHPQRFLKDFVGYLHTDGEEGYHSLPPAIVVVGCWPFASSLLGRSQAHYLGAFTQVLGEPAENYPQKQARRF